LNIKVIVAAADAVPDKVFVVKGGVHPEGDGFLTSPTDNTLGDRARRKGNFSIAVSTL
jgi:hypothetical protein